MNAIMNRISLVLELTGGIALLLTAIASDSGLPFRTTLIRVMIATCIFLLGAGVRALCSEHGRQLRRKLSASVMQSAYSKRQNDAA